MAGGSWYDADIDHVIISEAQIRDKIAELAKQVSADYAAVQDGLLLVCVLKGAVMFMADFARALGRHGPPVELEFMAVSSYGQGTTSSGVVRSPCLKKSSTRYARLMRAASLSPSSGFPTRSLITGAVWPCPLRPSGHRSTGSP